MFRFLSGFLLVGMLLVTCDRSLAQGKEDSPRAFAAQKQKGKAKPAKDDDAWSVDDVILAEEADDVRIAPDGRWAIWVKRAPDKEKNEMVAQLMLASLTDKKEIQLTRGGISSTS